MKKINAPFKKIFRVTLAKAQTNVPELSLKEKKSHAEMKKEKKIHRGQALHPEEMVTKGL